MNKELRKLINYHYRRAGYDPDLREFIVVLEKDGKLFKVGEILNCEGTYHKPKQIMELVEKHGYRIVLIYSCYRWSWSATRYISPYDERYHRTFNTDVYGRSYIYISCSGYYEKVDVFNKDGTRQRFESKSYICLDTSEEKVKFNNIPKQIEDLIYNVEWLSD